MNNRWLGANTEQQTNSNLGLMRPMGFNPQIGDRRDITLGLNPSNTGMSSPGMLSSFGPQQAMHMAGRMTGPQQSPMQPPHMPGPGSGGMTPPPPTLPPAPGGGSFPWPNNPPWAGGGGGQGNGNQPPPVQPPPTGGGGGPGGGGNPPPVQPPPMATSPFPTMPLPNQWGLPLMQRPYQTRAF